MKSVDKLSKVEMVRDIVDILMRLKGFELYAWQDNTGRIIVKYKDDMYFTISIDAMNEFITPDEVLAWLNKEEVNND